MPHFTSGIITMFLLFAQVVLHWEVFKDDVFIVSFLKRVHFTLLCSALCCVCPQEAVAPFLVVTRVFYVAMCSLCYLHSLYLLLFLLSGHRVSNLIPEELKVALQPHPGNSPFYFSFLWVWAEKKTCHLSKDTFDSVAWLGSSERFYCSLRCWLASLRQLCSIRSSSGARTAGPSAGAAGMGGGQPGLSEQASWISYMLSYGLHEQPARFLAPNCVIICLSKSFLWRVIMVLWKFPKVSTGKKLPVEWLRGRW